MQSNFFFDNLEYFITIPAIPLVVYGVTKFKNMKPSKNNLTPLIMKLNKQKEAMNKKSKSGIFS